MSVLLIDNGTTLLSQLERLIPGREIVRRWDNIADIVPDDYALIILSGGSRFSVVGNEKILSPEISLVLRTTVPIIGICYGCEVIVCSFGGTLEQMDKKKGIITVGVIEDDPIFAGQKTFSVYENHTWRIKDLPTDYVQIARSAHGIEAIRHASRPIYGFQFHPEHFVDKTEGDEIFSRLFQRLVK